MDLCTNATSSRGWDCKQLWFWHRSFLCHSKEINWLWCSAWQIWGGYFWLMSLCLLCWMHCRTMWTLWHTRSRYCTAVLSQLQWHILATQQSLSRRRWQVIFLHFSLRAYLHSFRWAGAFFGTTPAFLFFQSYHELAPAPFWKAPSSNSSSLSPRSASGSSGSCGPPFVNPNPHGGQKHAAGYVYVPRILNYGFKVSERAKSGPRMQWLWLRPESPSELDLVDWRGRWIDEDDEYDDDDEEEEEEEEDLLMEDFDPVGCPCYYSLCEGPWFIMFCIGCSWRGKWGRRRGGQCTNSRSIPWSATKSYTHATPHTDHLCVNISYIECCARDPRYASPLTYAPPSPLPYNHPTYPTQPRATVSSQHINFSCPCLMQQCYPVSLAKRKRVRTIYWMNHPADVWAGHDRFTLPLSQSSPHHNPSPPNHNIPPHTLPNPPSTPLHHPLCPHPLPSSASSNPSMPLPLLLLQPPTGIGPMHTMQTHYTNPSSIIPRPHPILSSKQQNSMKSARSSNHMGEWCRCCSGQWVAVWFTSHP